ncbi:MAG: hypothetical protein FJ109_15610 [Deltaproteobacteria bacterium]|nr:hypothetical protein [Deltaproteobacteria bacterium]
MNRAAGLTGWTGQSGKTALQALGILVVVVIVGFLAVRFIGAYIDVHGIEGDLNYVAHSLAVECAGDPECADTLILQIEQVREGNRRKVTMDYSTLDYQTSVNKLFVEGDREIDLLFRKITWRFTVTVDLFL